MTPELIGILSVGGALFIGLGGLMLQLRSDFRSDMNQLRADFRSELDQLRTENSQRHSDLSRRIDALASQRD